MSIFLARPAKGRSSSRLSESTAVEIIGSNIKRPPVRLVHIGLGAFHRAHQLWYTAVSDPENEWGVLAFTGRRPDEALTAAAQDGLFTLVERSEAGDSRTILTNLVEAKDGADVEELATALSLDAVVAVTLTITEAGYLLNSRGSLDLDDIRTQNDIAMWLAAGAEGSAPALQTPLCRLAYALDRRRRASGASVAVVPCDNFPDNGTTVGAALTELASRIDADLAAWLSDSVSFVSTVVDRITPATTSAEIERLAAETGYEDHSMVVTEPFAEWVLSGRFPAGRPEWERAGARFVDDVRPYQRRKLWLLNGGHTLLACTARHRGHETVADAMGDPVVRRWLTAYWDHVGTRLDGPATDLTQYVANLERRFENRGMAHRLDQIASDSVGKLRIRTLPLIGGSGTEAPTPQAVLLPISGWVAGVLRGRADPAPDDEAVARAASAPDPIAALLSVLDAGLAADAALVDVIARQVDAFLAGREPLPTSL